MRWTTRVAVTWCCTAMAVLAASPVSSSAPRSGALAAQVAGSTVTTGSKDLQFEARITELMRRMTLEQKVAQMIQADIRSVTPQDVRHYRLGAILNGGGAFPGNDKHAPLWAWLALADRFYDASMDTSGGAPAIPILWGTDAVHGDNNVFGATLFPHNVGLGAAHDLNEGCLVPRKPRINVLVAGDGADDIGKQAGGWSLTWQGTGNTNADLPGATSIYQGIHAAVAAAGGKATLSVGGTYRSKPDVAIVVFGENPYAEWHGDIQSLGYRGPSDHGPDEMQRPPPEINVLDELASLHTRGLRATQVVQSRPATAPNPDLALLHRLRRAGIPVISVFITGRVRGTTPELAASTAFAVAWLPGTEGGGVADVLFRKRNGTVNSRSRESYHLPGRAAASHQQTHGHCSPTGTGARIALYTKPRLKGCYRGIFSRLAAPPRQCRHACAAHSLTRRDTRGLHGPSCCGTTRRQLAAFFIIPWS